MKITLTDYDLTGLQQHEIDFCGNPAVLIIPEHIGVKFNQTNKIFRSSIWSMDGQLLSAGLPKFTNFGENPEHFPVPLNVDGVQFVTKIDGCCDENTLITTEDGDITIKEICETKYTGKVLCYDTTTSLEVFGNVKGHSIKSNNNDWFEIELEGGKTIKLTGNHRVWLPALNCYRAVKDLTTNDIFLLKK